MHSNLPTHLQSRARELEADIRRAFAGVTREGGVSWSEALVIDGFGGDADRRDARAKDLDRSWEELVGNPAWWDGSTWASHFSFLDPIGFRYYLPAAMLNSMRPYAGENLPYALTVGPPGRTIQIGEAKHSSDEVDEAVRQQWSLFTAEQSRCVAMFLRFMSDLEGGVCEAFESEWAQAHASHWHQFDPDPTPIK